MGSLLYVKTDAIHKACEHWSPNFMRVLQHTGHNIANSHNDGPFRLDFIICKCENYLQQRRESRIQLLFYVHLYIKSLL